VKDIQTLQQLFFLLLEQLLAPLEPCERGLQPLHIACRHIEHRQLRHLVVVHQLRHQALQRLELVLQLDATLALHRVVDLPVDLDLAVLQVGQEFAQAGRVRVHERPDGEGGLVILAAAGGNAAVEGCPGGTLPFHRRSSGERVLMFANNGRRQEVRL
jgi:hypothetical protein